jgi:4-hydroxybenzoate polyprenyltransferase
MTDLRPYAQLVRLPNLPTAWADICLAALATHALPERWLPFALLLAASSCLYCGGMVWNDFFDVEQDRRERAFRPIPSGRISLRQAALLGGGLLIGGVLLAALSGLVQVLRGEAVSLFLPVIMAGLLVTAILLYDGWLKRTPLGPVAMGSCRLLNVLLGITVSGSLAWPLGTHLALVVGLYIVGVTWLARTEAQESSRNALIGAVVLMAFALGLALLLPVHVPAGTASPLFPYLLVGFGFWLAVPLIRAVQSPVPSRVQSAVKRALMGLILLDATLAAGLAGTIGLVILVLLVPSLYLNRRAWLYAT